MKNRIPNLIVILDSLVPRLLRAFKQTPVSIGATRLSDVRRRAIVIWNIFWASIFNFALIMTANAGTPQVSVVYNQFTNVLNSRPSLSGADPIGPLLLGPDGYLYGIAQQGGVYGGGTVFKVQPNGNNFQVLHNFGNPSLLWKGESTSDGVQPNGGLVMYRGYLFGTTEYGGTVLARNLWPGNSGANGGTIFQVKTNDDGTDPPGKYFVVHAFGGSAKAVISVAALPGVYVPITVADGFNPTAPLTQDANNPFLFYGTVETGAAGGCGAVFSYEGLNYFALHSFSGPDGANPSGAVVQNGNYLYGTTFGGGAGGIINGLGTIFAVNTSTIPGNFTNLWSFTGGFVYNDGWNPQGPIILYAEPVGDNGIMVVGTTFFSYTSGWPNAVNSDIGQVFSLPVSLANAIPAADPNKHSIGVPSPTVPTEPGGLLLVESPSGPTANGWSTPGVMIGASQIAIWLMTTDLKSSAILFNQFDLDPGTYANYAEFPTGALIEGPDNELYGAADDPSAGQDYNFPSGVLFKFALVPQNLTITPPNITWPDPPGLALQSATNLLGPWTTLVGATSPYPYNRSLPRQFFRLAFGATNLAASAPSAFTLPVMSIGNSNATLYGAVVPNGADCTSWFQYGPTTNYGSTTPTTYVSATNYLYPSNSIGGLVPGATYHYELVATNSAGTSVGSDGTFTTLPFGASAPSVTTLAASSVSANNAVLNGIVTGNGLNTTILWEYGTTTNYGLSSSNFMASDGPVSFSLSGLFPGMLYHFQLVAQNAAGTSLGGDLSFTTISAAPAVATAPATIIDSTDFVLNGVVVPDGLNSTAWFQYGTTTNYGSVTPMTLVSPGSPSAVTNLVQELTAGVIYHYRIVATNSAGSATGLDLTITAAPNVTTLAASDIGPSSAVLNGFVDPGGADSTAWFQWGITTNYGNLTAATLISTNSSLSSSNSIFDGPDDSFVTNLISGLAAGVTYHYQLVASNSAGSATGADMTFVTLQSAITLPASGVESGSATLNGYVSADGFSSWAYFEYGTSTNYGMATAPVFVSGTNTSAVFSSAAVAGLLPGTLYHFQLVATNSTGAAAGGDVTFTTGEPSCATPPSGLVNWWPADGNADDIIGGDNGILEGGVSYTNGEVGEAFSFDGSSGYVATSLAFTNPQIFSLTLWFQTTTTNGGVLIGFDSDQYIQSGDSYDRNIYMDNTGALHFGVWNGGAAQVNTGPGYNDGNWHYVVGSLSTDTALSLYIDGVLVGNNPAVTNAQEDYTGYWRIGQDNLDNWPPQYQPNSYYFQGQIDEVAIFDTALDSTNVTAIYDAGSNGMCPPITAPTVATLAATSITTSNVVLNGTVNPNGTGTTWWFQYAQNSTNYNETTATGFLPAQYSNSVVSTVANGIKGAMFYDFQLVASNLAGTSTGSNLTFSTPGPR
jgi:uncharacterized repeat protein (TIGR03803 family)